MNEIVRNTGRGAAIVLRNLIVVPLYVVSLPFALVVLALGALSEYGAQHRESNGDGWRAIFKGWD